MTWLGDPNAKLPAAQREKLIKEREDIVAQISKLKVQALPLGNKELMAKFRQRDLLELATKVVKIDEKLGRN